MNIFEQVKGYLYFFYLPFIFHFSTPPIFQIECCYNVASYNARKVIANPVLSRKNRSISGGKEEVLTNSMIGRKKKIYHAKDRKTS